MATVGINFGAANSGQGFDVATTVTAIQASEAAIEAPWKTQLAALQAQDAVLTSLGTDLSTLTTSLQALTDLSGVLSAKQGSSSDSSLLALTGATSAAIAGSHTVVITSLAQTSSNYSDVVANAADTLSGSITIQVGSGAAQTVTVGSGSNTLSTLAAAINAAAVGVNASVITDANGSRLSLVSSTGGSAGQLTITSALNDDTTSTAIAYHVGQPGANAVLKVDGIDVSSASNTVTTAIPGVSFQLLSTSAPGTQIQVQITNDNASVSTALSGLVNAYNAVVKDIKTQEGKDANGNAEPLYGSPTLAAIQNQLSGALFGGTASGAIKNVTQLGITFNPDGTLALNNDTLQAALTTNYADITGFLQNSGSFGATFAQVLNGLGSQSTSGTIYLAQQQNVSQEGSLNQSISDQDARLAAQKIILTDQLNAANQILQSIPSQLNQVNELYSAITGYNTGNQ